MLRIQTFDARAGGNVIYKALAHPLAAEALARLYERLDGSVALYDPDGIADALLAMYPATVDSLFVHDVSAVGQIRGGLTARPPRSFREPDRAPATCSGSGQTARDAFPAARRFGRSAPETSLPWSAWEGFPRFRAATGLRREARRSV